MRQELSPLQTQYKQRLDYDELLNCTRCGFCQPTCPTFVETGKEASSPRGRIALMRAVAEGLLEPDADFEKELSLCLGCRACETACPSGVQYGQLLEQAREVVQQHKHYSRLERWLRRIFFQVLLPHQGRLRMVGTLLWLYQVLGLQWLVRRMGIFKLYPGNLYEMEAILPRMKSPFAVKKALKYRSSSVRPTSSERPGSDLKASFFTGCIMDVLFQETNENTLKLLQLADYTISISTGQVCCGALHAHSGEVKQARELAKQNIAAFEQEKVDHIVTNAGGCGAFLKEYHHLLQNEPEWATRAQEFVSKVKDISEVLNTERLPKLKTIEQVVTYQDSCHLRHGMKVDSAPRALLHSITGLQFKELKGADQCCGSAGIYNLIETDMSMQILDHKMEKVKQTQARTIVTSNPGCLLQMKLGIKRSGLEEQLQAVHLVDLITEALQEESKSRVN